MEEVHNNSSISGTARCSSPDMYFKANKHGVAMPVGQQQTILNVYTYLRKTNPPMMSTDAAIRTAEMCGVCVNSVIRIRKTIRDGKELPQPSGKRNPRTTAPSNTILDDFTKSATRRKIHQCFFKKEKVTLSALKRKMEADQSIPKMSRSTLHRCLKTVGFRYDKKGLNGVMIEREDIIFWRRNYVRQIRNHRQQCRSIVYLDETWLKSGNKATKTPRHAFIEGLMASSDIPSGDGGRSIVLHSGRKDGFLGSIQIAFLARRGVAGNLEMDGEQFRKWVEGQLLPNIPEKSVIIMDNATYHTAQNEPLPQPSAKKSVLQEWLTKKNIPWTSNMSKGELHTTLLSNKQKAKSYIIDHLVQEKGHDVLRLPPYHCELNPVEMAWGKIKLECAITNASFKMKDVQDKLATAVAAMTSHNWEDLVEQVMKTEESFWLAECLQGESETPGMCLGEMDCEEEQESDEDVEMQHWA